MAKIVSKKFRKRYSRLRQILERLIKPGNRQQMPQLVLQPVKRHPLHKPAAGKENF